jgi:asparagine synthase (glutamine-hydrolysing)
MCGIVGQVNAGGAPVSASALAAMRDVLIHRGPDDAGLHVDGSVGLGARRLAIFDLTPAGHQPMSSRDGNLWVVFNGAIYNHVELAAELRAEGHGFVSRTDTEVLLHLYARFGKECVHRLNGMFAFAIWNARERTLFAARDRFGIKPFHYHHTAQRFLFASEAKALVQMDPTLARANHEAVADYLFAGSPLGDKTGFADVRQLEPGHSLTWREGRLEIRRYWDITYRYDDPSRETDLIGELAWLVDDAVRIQSRSDVPVGTHLSGGLDSSAVASHAARYVHPLRTFSISFEGGPYYDETSYARTVSEHIGAIHLNDVGRPGDLTALLPALVYHMDFALPVWGAFGYFAVSRLARQHVTVALTGHGGDELFAGYPKHFGATAGSTAMFDASAQPQHTPPMIRRVLTMLRHQGITSVTRRLLRRFQTPLNSLEDRWIAFHCAEEPAQHPMVHPGFVRGLGGYSPRPAYIRPLREARTDEDLDKCLYHDLRVYLPQLLAMEDRMSMAVSLESRVPLLDHRIVELLARTPAALKISGRRPKRLLRDILPPLLPESIRERKDKAPFPVPVDQWMTREMSTTVRDILESPRALDRGIFDPDRLRDKDRPFGLTWTLLNVELWFRIFVDRDPAVLEQVGWLGPRGVIKSPRVHAESGRTL